MIHPISTSAAMPHGARAPSVATRRAASGKSDRRKPTAWTDRSPGASQHSVLTAVRVQQRDVLNAV
jgi:hypothetical protein